MPEADFSAQAQALRALLGACAVLYWQQAGPALAVPLGAVPAGLVEGGFRLPAWPEGVRRAQGREAFVLLPLRMRGILESDTCTVVTAGMDGRRAGIAAVWSGAGAPPEAAEAAMAFALAAFRGHLDAAGSGGEQSPTRRLSAMADALPHGVIVVPAGNRPGYVNRPAAELLGLPPGEAEAERLADRLAEFAQRATDHEAICAQVGAFIAGHGDFPMSGRVWRFPEGSPKALRVSVAPLDSGHAAGWFWLLEDVSAAEAEAEARERQRRLEWLNAELEQRVNERTGQLEHANEILLQTNIELQHFAHAMAHDLQTPLRSIAGLTQLVRQKVGAYGDADVDAWTAQVVGSTRRLQDLIRGLLAYTRLDAQAIRAEPVDMGALFHEVAASLQAMIAETRAEVGCGPLPTVCCLRTQIGQVLQNLIENGLKYNTAAHPRVEVSARREGGDWIFAVADNGMGIAPEHHRQIFGMFKRLHAYDRIPGTGIGLALCRRIVENHGGRIWVESQAGAGATFYFSLPVERAAAASYGKPLPTPSP